MKRVLILAFLPVLLLALERVNLIKDHSFEKDSEVWHAYVSRDSAIANPHDSESAFNGFYSASCDTRKYPGTSDRDSAIVIQGLRGKKIVADIDSLLWDYSVLPLGGNINRSFVGFIGLYIDASETTYWTAGYAFKAPDLGDPHPLPPERFLEVFDFSGDTGWHFLSKGIRIDLERVGITPDATVDSLILRGSGFLYPSWRGQKIYWDDIRLMGYADYDVGVKEILSGDSVWAGTFYKPIARIKNFGRQPADDFLAISEIRQGESLVWVDTIPHTLPADTEDTLTFDSFPVPDAANYTLTIRTEMTPDECDEDDEMSKTLYGTAIAENSQPQPINLEVQSFTSSSPRISYSLPAGQSGTISIYDASGRRVESKLVSGPGQMPLAPLPVGVYFVRLEAGKTALTKEAVLLR